MITVEPTASAMIPHESVGQRVKAASQGPWDPRLRAKGLGILGCEPRFAWLRAKGGPLRKARSYACKFGHDVAAPLVASQVVRRAGGRGALAGRSAPALAASQARSALAASQARQSATALMASSVEQARGAKRHYERGLARGPAVGACLVGARAVRTCVRAGGAENNVCRFHNLNGLRPSSRRRSRNLDVFIKASTSQP